MVKKPEIELNRLIGLEANAYATSFLWSWVGFNNSNHE